MDEIDVTNKRIFCKSSHPDFFCKKGALKYLVKLTGKHVYSTAQKIKFFIKDLITSVFYGFDHSY